jgi:cytoskeletal protein CcmA (bactofilin family)
MLPSFKKSEPESPRLALATPPPAPAFATRGGSPAPRGGGPSVIGPDVKISGNLLTRGDVQIEGEIEGDVRAVNVVIGERASVTGSVLAEEVVVRGHVMGSVRGRRVMLQASCHVEGDVYHQALSIEQGAYFEGKSRRSADPLGESAPSATGDALPRPTVATVQSRPAATVGPPKHPVAHSLPAPTVVPTKA